MMIANRKIDSAWVERLVHDVSWRPAYQSVKHVVPVVLFEVQALGPQAQVVLGTRAVKLRLEDGLYYKLKYSHDVHALALYRMIGARANGTLVATFTNTTPQDEVWQALHPNHG